MLRHRSIHPDDAFDVVHKNWMYLRSQALLSATTSRELERLALTIDNAWSEVANVVWAMHFTSAAQNAHERYKLKRQSERMDATLSRLMKPVTKARSFNAKGHFVYQLINEAGEPVYIGMSSNLMNRLGAHASDKRKQPHLATVKFVEVETRADAEELETRLISHFQPMLNSYKKAAA